MRLLGLGSASTPRLHSRCHRQLTQPDDSTIPCAEDDATWACTTGRPDAVPADWAQTSYDGRLVGAAARTLSATARDLGTTLQARHIPRPAC